MPAKEVTITPFYHGYWSDPLFNAFDLLDHPLTQLVHPEKRQASAPFTPVNLSETPDAYKVSAEVPGFKKDEISVDVVDRTLTLKGEHKESRVSEDESHLRVERSRSTKFERSVRLPAQIDPSNVSANLDHGILEISIGKLKATVGGRVPIPIQ
jgi:HSP20 family protein